MRKGWGESGKVGDYQGRRTRKNSGPMAGSVTLSMPEPRVGMLVTHCHCAEGPRALLASSSVSAMVFVQETVTWPAVLTTLSCTGLPMTIVPLLTVEAVDTVDVTVQW